MVPEATAALLIPCNKINILTALNRTEIVCEPSQAPFFFRTTITEWCCWGYMPGTQCSLSENTMFFVLINYIDDRKGTLQSNNRLMHGLVFLYFFFLSLRPWSMSKSIGYPRFIFRGSLVQKFKVPAVREFDMHCRVAGPRDQTDGLPWGELPSVPDPASEALLWCS